MLNIFKKEPRFLTDTPQGFSTVAEPVKVESKPTPSVTVEEIHESFFTEVDRLLADAKVLNSLHSDKQEMLGRAERLKALGFYGTKTVKESHGEYSRLRDLEDENYQKETIQKAINYFSQKYPQHKFITEESVKKICKKYGLIYGEVSNFIGDVPEKNLRHIEDFKIETMDECFEAQQYIFTNFGWMDHGLSYILSGDKAQGLNTDWSFYEKPHELNDLETIVTKQPMLIAAPITDFDTTHMKIEDSKLVSNAPDPVVLYPVHFESRKYYLIVTAWGGPEASDELVMNPNHN